MKPAIAWIVILAGLLSASQTALAAKKTSVHNRYENIVVDETDEEDLDQKKIVTHTRMDLKKGYRSVEKIYMEPVYLSKDFYLPKSYMLIGQKLTAKKQATATLMVNDTNIAKLADEISAYAVSRGWKAEPADIEEDHAVLQFNKRRQQPIKVQLCNTRVEGTVYYEVSNMEPAFAEYAEHSCRCNCTP